MRKRVLSLTLIAAIATLALGATGGTSAEKPFPLEDVLSPAYPMIQAMRSAPIFGLST